MLPKSPTSKNAILMKQKSRTISSLQECQSRIQSRVSISNKYNEQQQRRLQEYESFGEWVQQYNRSHSLQYFTCSRPLSNSSILKRYLSFPQQNKFIKMKIKRLVNIQIDLRLFNNSFSNSSQFRGRRQSNNQSLSQQYYVQYSIKFYDQQSQEDISSIPVFNSELFRLHGMENLRQRYQMNDELQLYFYFDGEFNKIIAKIKVLVMLCAKNNKMSIVLDKQTVGSINVDFNDQWKRIYEIQPALQYNFTQKNDKEDSFNQKIDDYAEIELTSLSFTNSNILSQILSPFKVYPSETKIHWLANKSIPKSIDSEVKFSFTPFTTTFQLTQVTLPQSLVHQVKSRQQSLIRVKYNNIKKIEETQIKEFRMVICCHNGQKIISSSNCILKKVEEQKSSIKKSNQRKGPNKTNQNKRQNTTQSEQAIRNFKELNRDHILRLRSQSMGRLDLVFNLEGVLIISQIFCRLQSKIQLKDSSQIVSESITLPVAYALKPISSLENDIKYTETLFSGQFLGPKGIQNYFVQHQKKIQHEEKISRLNPNAVSKLSSYQRMMLKADHMTKSFIEFYIFKQEKQGKQRNNTIEMSQSNNLSVSQLNKGTSNQLNRLIMQKARIQRQRQKMQQKIHRINVENNRTIPLLDPTDLKVQLYQEKLKTMKQSKYELKMTLNFLKSKVDEFQRREAAKKQLISDTLGRVFENGQNPGNNQLTYVGMKMIGAKGGNRWKQNGFEKTSQQQKNINRKNFMRSILPNNSKKIDFQLNIKNIFKIVNYLNANKNMQIVLTNFKELNNQFNKQSNCFKLMGGFGKLINIGVIKQIKETPNPPNQIQKDTVQQEKFYLQIPQISANLLLTILFGPFCLYFVNQRTDSIFGMCYIFLSQLCNKIIKLESSADQSRIQINEKCCIFNKSLIVGYADAKVSIKNGKQNDVGTDTKSISQNTRNILKEVEQSLSMKQEPQQKRKLLRIERLKKKMNNSQKQSNLNSNQNMRQQKQFNSFPKNQLTIKSYQFNYAILKLTLRNNSSQVKTYRLSINDPDSRILNLSLLNDNTLYDNSEVGNGFASKNGIMELQMIYDDSFLTTSEKLVTMLEEDEKVLLKLDAYCDGVILLKYFSTRKVFASGIKSIRLNQLETINSPIQYSSNAIINQSNLSLQHLFLQQYNHPHTITANLFTSFGQLQQPRIDNNILYFNFYVESQKQFAIPLPQCELIEHDSIYFEHKQFQLVKSGQGEWQGFSLCGLGPQLSKVNQVNVLVYPKPSKWKMLVRNISQMKINSEKEFEQRLLIRQLIQSEKILNLSINVWGCEKVLRLQQLRLFQLTDILFPIENQHLFQRLQESNHLRQPHKNNQYLFDFYLCSTSTPIGFRSKKHFRQLQSQRKISLDPNQQKTLIKAVTKSHRVGNDSVILQAKHPVHKQIILCRYIIDISTNEPHFEDKLIFQLNYNQLKQIIESQNTHDTPLLENAPKTIKKKFMLDISALVARILENLKYKKENENKLVPQDEKQKEPDHLADINKNMKENVEFHSTQNCFSILSLQNQVNQNQIKKFLQIQNQKYKSRQSPQKGNPQKIPSSDNKLKNQNIQRSWYESSQKNFFRNKTLQTFAKQTYIANIQLSLDEFLLQQNIKIQQAFNNDKNESNLSLYEQVVIKHASQKCPIMQSIVALSFEEKILYYKVEVVLEQQEAKKLQLIRQVFEKSRIVNQKEDYTKFNGLDNGMVKNIFDPKQIKKTNQYPQGGPQNFFLNQFLNP